MGRALPGLHALWALALVFGCQTPTEEPGPLELPPGGEVDLGGPAVDLPPGVVRGAPDRLLLLGRVVTPQVVLPRGEVLVTGDRITCVAESCTQAPGAAGATVLQTAGTIYPGLIDAHNHTQYNYLPPWRPMRTFTNRGQWQRLPEYDEHTRSVNTGERMYACEQAKYGEIRALLGGVTTMQGTGNVNRRCYRTLVHNAEYGNEFGADRMRTEVLGIGSVDATEAARVAAEMADGTTTAYLIHLAEGTDEASRREFDELVRKGLLHRATVIIHGTALGPAELQQVRQAGAKLVWSPQSNLQLYGRTTDVRTAVQAGIPVALAPDWTLSGSATILRELKVAARISSENGGFLSAQRLCEMVTSTAADVLGLGDLIGRLREGAFADLLVLDSRGGDAYQALVGARPEQVQLVVVSGRLRYGDPRLMDAVPQARCERLDLCGVEKRLCVPDSQDAADKLDQDLGAIRAAIQTFYAAPYRLDVCD